MLKSIVYKVCLIVAAKLVFINYPTLATIKINANLAISNNLVLNQAANEQSKELEDPILEDVVLNRVDKLKQFLDKGGSPDRYFHAAVNAGAIDSVTMMISRGANVNLPGNEGVTPLMTSVRATYRGTIEITELLIKNGANVNARAGRGSTALMYASSGVAAHYENDYVRVVRLLIKNGAKVNIKNRMGATPLSIAKEGKWKKIVAVLKKSGAKF
ncbi:ankyrin repeat domain-containing protein [Chamaesiphon sp. GL140_3_metabinner_50]|uniref:ankyrin repeat domain-containing protein n=1 Tax=Chamaesiphon sp. GL140_3_metabinner_50 TaxID=2970812 RepID=UPI0025D83F78|nr:ankyrin repeat domain-containing protein [Chamaesiphon sp. GL140_3_metabinner_50]